CDTESAALAGDERADRDGQTAFEAGSLEAAAFESGCKARNHTLIGRAPRSFRVCPSVAVRRRRKYAKKPTPRQVKSRCPVHLFAACSCHLSQFVDTPVGQQKPAARLRDTSFHYRNVAGADKCSVAIHRHC